MGLQVAKGSMTAKVDARVRRGVVWSLLTPGRRRLGGAGQAAQRPELGRHAQSVLERSGDTVLRSVFQRLDRWAMVAD